MSYNDYGWPKYVSVAEKRAKAAKKLAQLRKKNCSPVNPVIIEGTMIACSWWGKEWNKNLERYSDYSNRIGRGRSYVRNGAVLDLCIEKGKVRALVQGSRSKPYEIQISIKEIEEKTWEEIRSTCEGKLDSLAELLEGKFPKELSELFTATGKGLFPSPREIKFECSCPDWASMCKHVAAALFGIGARLDSAPALFFVLRNVDVHDLITETIDSKSRALLTKSGNKGGRIIEDADVSAMFGIEIAKEASTTPAVSVPPKKRVSSSGQSCQKRSSKKQNSGNATSEKKTRSRK